MAPPNPTPPSSASAASNSDASNTSSSPPPPLPRSSIAAAAASSSNTLNFLRIPCPSSCCCAAAHSNTEADAVPRLPRANPKLKLGPVIGILSHPGDGAGGRLNNAPNASYIAASYVKFVESAGARVIPLIYNEPLVLRNEKLNLVNGVIFTGGSSKRTSYFDVVKSIFENVRRKNDAGEHFPLLAICLGFELLTMIVSEKKNILEKFDALNQATTLDNIDVNGNLFQRFPEVLRNKLSTKCLVMQNHSYGISLAKFRRDARLNSFFKILATSTDKKNKPYVSTVQARKYPVTAVQWHPEKNAFEWGLSGIPHSEDAVQVTQHVANFFVREARISAKNKPKPSPRKVLDNLIYNYSPTYCGKAGKGFDEVYIFSSTLCQFA
ncbi:hypothetical protein ACP275_08G199100 [Erythranthe tilingii]